MLLEYICTTLPLAKLLQVQFGWNKSDCFSGSGRLVPGVDLTSKGIYQKPRTRAGLGSELAQGAGNSFVAEAQPV